MTEQRNGGGFFDWECYVKNRSKWTFEELLAYEDQWVAWSRDGTRVVAHHQDLMEVGEQLKAQGIDSEQVLLEHIPEGGEFSIL
jgi:Family of unknown function (DUF5678)